MTYGAGTPDDFILLNRGRLSRKPISHTISGAFALAISLLAGGSILYVRFAMGPSVEDATPVRKIHKTPKARSADKTAVFGSLGKGPAIHAQDKTPATIALADIPSTGYDRLLDPSFSLGAHAGSAWAKHAARRQLCANFAGALRGNRRVGLCPAVAGSFRKRSERPLADAAPLRIRVGGRREHPVADAAPL